MSESPRTTGLQELLRSCVQCGLCLPHCATWLGTGSEVQSPRGRLILLQEWLRAGDSDAGSGFLAAFDQCIGCRACETACPSGVPFELLEHGQRAAQRSDSYAAAGSVPQALLHRLDQPGWLRPLGSAARTATGLLRTLLGSGWRARLERGPGAGLGRLLGTLPHSPRRDADLLDLILQLERRAAPAPGSAAPAADFRDPPAVAFFRGCANDALLPQTSRRMIQILHAAGCRVRFPEGQECCGALATHTGRPQRAARRHESNRKVFGPAAPEELILVEAAGCGLEWRQSQPELADRVTDAVVLLSQLALPKLGPVGLRVVVHDPCHARHGQGIGSEPRRLLDRIPGLERLEAEETEVCCGSGGAWGLRYPELSQELGRRKAALLAETGADLIVTSNPGCLGQIADGLALEAPEVPILPLTDLLWVAYRRGMANPA